MRKNNINFKGNDYVDLTILLRQVWRKKFIIILSAIIFSVISLSVSIFVLKPMYKSMTKIYIVNRSDSAEITAQDLQTGDLLIQDYQEIILSNSVLEAVAKDVHIGVSQIQSKVEVDAPKDNRILTITAVDESPRRAALLANKTREESIDKIKEITKVEDVTVIEKAKVAKKPYSPNIKKNAILGFLFGFIISIAGVVTKEVLDDRIKITEDVENYLGTIVIGVIPKINVKRK